MLVLSKTCQKSERSGGIYRQNCQTAVKTFAKIDNISKIKEGKLPR